MKKYSNRKQAGAVLAQHLIQYTQAPKTQILALPRGGVPVAYEVAKALCLPLDVYIVRKLGAPGQEEYALGALAPKNVLFLNKTVIQSLSLPKERIEQIIKEEAAELKRREKLYRGKRPFPSLKGKNLILIDDGIATGATVLAAIQGLRKYKPAKIILAVPVAAFSSINEMSDQVEELICPLRPYDFCAVGLWYDDFSQTTDEEVMELLTESF